jgi:hypothetical protein
VVSADGALIAGERRLKACLSWTRIPVTVVNLGRSSAVHSFALQHGADNDAIRKALCRDSEGRALGPLGAALNLLAADEAEGG